MRGPMTRPASIARLRPKAGPAMSRTLVKPRISVFSASWPARRLMKPTSAVISTFMGAAAIIACQCASMRSGHQHAAGAIDDPDVGAERAAFGGIDGPDRLAFDENPQARAQPVRLAVEDARVDEGDEGAGRAARYASRRRGESPGCGAER